MKRLFPLLLAICMLLSGCLSDPLGQVTRDPEGPGYSTSPAQPTAPAQTLPPETLETKPTEPVTVVEAVVFDHFFTGSQECGTLTGYDKDGNAVWIYNTSEYPVGQLDYISDIGADHGQYYIVENGNILAFDCQTGRRLWLNHAFGGSPASTNAAVFDEKGNLYICGYFGPDFFAVRKDGTTLHAIDTIHQDYFWAYKIELEDNWLTIYLDGGPYGDVAEEEAYRAHINLDTLGSEISSIEQAEALAEAMYGDAYVLYRSWEENGGYVVTMRWDDTLVKLFVDPSTGILVFEGFA